MKILVTDANNRVTLSVIRALGKEGCEIYAIEQDKFAQKTPLSFYSRYVKKHWVVPALENEDSFIEKVKHISKGIDIIIPISTNTVLTFAKNRSLFESDGIKIPLPKYDVILEANRKDFIQKLALKLQIPIPINYNIPNKSAGISEIISFLNNKAKLPIVIKLRSDEGLYLEPKFRYKIIYKWQDFEKEYLELHKIQEFPVIQEYIDGEGYGFSALFENSEPRAIFCHKRIREYPATGGPSTFCIGIYEKALVENGIKLLSALNWHGVAMVEFKKDKRDGLFKLMEVNPRFWGALPLAIYSGVNFPYLLCKMAMREKIKPILKYNIGKKMRFIFLDLASLVSSYKIGKFSNHCKSFFTNICDLNVKDGILNINDIRPSLAYLKNKLI